jgi:hypothetical protein
MRDQLRVFATGRIHAANEKKHRHAERPLVEEVLPGTSVSGDLAVGKTDGSSDAAMSGRRLGGWSVNTERRYRISGQQWRKCRVRN